MRVAVSEVIERDTDRVLVGGDVIAASDDAPARVGDRVTFHVRASSQHLARIDRGIRGGRPIEMEINR